MSLSEAAYFAIILSSLKYLNENTLIYQFVSTVLGIFIGVLLTYAGIFIKAWLDAEALIKDTLDRILKEAELNIELLKSRSHRIFLLEEGYRTAIANNVVSYLPPKVNNTLLQNYIETQQINLAKSIDYLTDPDKKVHEQRLKGIIGMIKGLKKANWWNHKRILRNE